MKRSITFFAGLIASISVWAQSAMPFVRIDRDPVSLSMGGSQIVSPLYNPASASQNNCSEATISYSLWSPENFNQNLINAMGYIKAGSNMSVGFALNYDILPSYYLTDSAGNESDKTFAPSNLIASAGIGYNINPHFSVGGTIHFALQKNTEKNTYNSVFADIIANYITGNLTVSAGILSIGGKVGGTYSLPSSVTSGAVYKIELGKNTLNADMELDYFISGGLSSSIGAEYCFGNKYYARAGFHYSTDKSPIPTFLSLGAGINISKISINIAYITANSIIGNSLSIGLGYSF